MSLSYRLTQSILAIQIAADQTSQKFVYVPVSAIISYFPKNHHNQQVLVEADWEGHTIFLFEQDLHSRAQLIREQPFSPLSLAESCAA